MAAPKKGIGRRRFLALGAGAAAVCAYAAVDIRYGGPLSTLVETGITSSTSVRSEATTAQPKTTAIETTTSLLAKPKLPSDVSIGIVYPLSGRLDEWGHEGVPFINIAEADISNLPEAKAAGVRFHTVVRSSDTTGEGALAAVKDLVENEHIQVIAGLPTSAELEGAIEYLAGNNVAAVSSASTAPTPILLKPDTVFRIMPTELYMARRLAELSMYLGYHKCAVIYRTDQWGPAYAAEISARFTSQGYPTANVAIEPTHPHVTDYAAEVKQLSDRVAQLGADKEMVVIMAVWEGEDLNILHHAAQDPVLSSVRWLSAVLYPGLLTGQFEGPPSLNLPDARDFALSHQIWGQENHPPSNELLRRIWTQAKADLGLTPRFEHVYVYDAIQTVARALMLAGTQEGQAVAASIPAAVKGYDSATGPIELDNNGDRVTGDLDYYGLFKDGTQYEYRYYAYFHEDGGFEVLKEPEKRETEFCPEC